MRSELFWFLHLPQQVCQAFRFPNPGSRAPPPPVDITAQEQITTVRQLTESLKKVQELIIVAMHIAHNNLELVEWFKTSILPRCECVLR